MCAYHRAGTSSTAAYVVLVASFLACRLPACLVKKHIRVSSDCCYWLSLIHISKVGFRKLLVWGNFRFQIAVPVHNRRLKSNFESQTP